MTVLAQTDEYLVEYEGGRFRLLTIARYSDGQCLAFTGKRVAGEFRDCLKTHSPERVIQTYLKIARSLKMEWEPLYRPGCVPTKEDFEEWLGN